MPTNVSGTLKWGDGEQQDLNLVSRTQPGSNAKLFVPLSHRYENIGNYTVEVELFNVVSRATNTKDVKEWFGLTPKLLII